MPSTTRVIIVAVLTLAVGIGAIARHLFENRRSPANSSAWCVRLPIDS